MTPLIKSDKLAQMRTSGVSPIGRTVQQAAARRRARSAGYRAAEEKFARTHEIAKLLIHLRTELGLTQDQVARRSGTSHSQISRIESGRHDVNTKTLHKIFGSLGVTPLFGYDKPARGTEPGHREFVAI